MEQLGQIPLGVTLALRVLNAGALQNSKKQRVAHFSQTDRIELGLNSGAMGLIDLSGQDFQFLNGWVHITSLLSIINPLIINVLTILAREDQKSRGEQTVYNLFTQTKGGTGKYLSLPVM